MKPWLLLAGIAISGGAEAGGEPSPYAGIPGIRFEYYNVEGSTPEAIYASMRARSPMGKGEADGLGRTTWQIDVRWRESTRGRLCTVSEPSARLTITVLLPRLVTKQLSPEGLSYWRAVRAGLDIHEAGHARIAWEHRGDFARAAARASCKSIHKVARASQARIIALQASYDRATDHGRLQTPEWNRQAGP